MADNCAKCGRNLVLVGRVHNCVPNMSPNGPIRSPNNIGGRLHGQGVEVPPSVGTREATLSQVGSGSNPVPSSTSRNARWRAKNPEAYRAYMKSYMAKRRKGSQTGPMA